MEQTQAAAAGQPRIDPRALTPPTAAAERAANLLVLVVVALALGLGWGLKVFIENRTAIYNDPTVTFNYPATWVTDNDDDDNPMVRDAKSGSTLFNNRVAGVLASSVAVAVGWALARYAFEFTWTASPLVPLAGGLVGAVLALLAGWWGLREVLRRPVVDTLRRATE